MGSVLFRWMITFLHPQGSAFGAEISRQYEKKPVGVGWTVAGLFDCQIIWRKVRTPKGRVLHNVESR